SGQVRITSQVGQGTTVQLYLPRAEPVAAPAADPGALDLARPVGPATILVVEDNSDVRELVCRQLSELGYRVLNAEDGGRAIEMLRDEPAIDLLFTDVVMPGGVSGLQLAATAKELRPALKVLFTSGFPDAEEDDRARMQALGGMLSKPYRKATLARRLAEVLAAGDPAA